MALEYRKQGRAKTHGKQLYIFKKYSERFIKQPKTLNKVYFVLFAILNSSILEHWQARKIDHVSKKMPVFVVLPPRKFATNTDYQNVTSIYIALTHLSATQPVPLTCDGHEHIVFLAKQPIEISNSGCLELN